MTTWSSKVPEKCDYCGTPVKSRFIDGASACGWAIMCTDCHNEYGRGLGTGKGQAYRKQEDGKFHKVQG